MPYEGPIVDVLTVCQVQHRLAIVAAAYARKPRKVFRTIPNMEEVSEHVLRTYSTNNTILEPAVVALNEADIHTAPLIGDLMDNLGINFEQMHDLACACNGCFVQGDYMAQRFDTLAAELMQG
jgi:hypothetical protein